MRSSRNILENFKKRVSLYQAGLHKISTQLRLRLFRSFLNERFHQASHGHSRRGKRAACHGPTDGRFGRGDKNEDGPAGAISADASGARGQAFRTTEIPDNE